MSGNSFLTSLWAGAASPTLLYAPLPAYNPPILGYTVSNSFAHVGVSLTAVTAPISNGGQSLETNWGGSGGGATTSYVGGGVSGTTLTPTSNASLTHSGTTGPAISASFGYDPIKSAG